MEFIMTLDAWNKLTIGEKLDYLFRKSDEAEQRLNQLGSGLQYLHERLKKVELKVAETAE
jgi:hypothetical protein